MKNTSKTSRIEGPIGEAEYNQLVDKVVSYHNGYIAANRIGTRKDSIKAVARYSGYSQREIREALKYAEKTNAWDVRANNKIKGYELDKMAVLYNEGKSFKDIASDIGRSESSVKRWIRGRYAESNVTWMRNPLPYSSVGALDGNDPAAGDEGETGRERILRERREASQSRLPAVDGEGEGHIPTLITDKPTGDAPAGGQPYQLPGQGAKKKKETLGRRLEKVSREQDNLFEDLHGKGGAGGGLIDNVEGLHKKYDTVNSVVGKIDEAINGVEGKDGAESRAGLVQDIRTLNNAIIEPGPDSIMGKAKQISSEQTEQSKRLSKIEHKSFMSKAIPYVLGVGLAAGVAVAGWFGYQDLKKSINDRPAVVQDVRYDGLSANVTKIEKSMAEQGKALEERANASDKRADNLDVKVGGLETKVAELDNKAKETNVLISNVVSSVDGLGKYVQDLGAKVDDKVSALGKELKGYVDGANSDLRSGMKVIERNVGEVSDKLDAHLNAQKEVPVVATPAVPEVPAVTPVAEPEKNFVSVDASGALGSNSNESRLSLKGKAGSLDFVARVLDLRYGPSDYRKSMTEGEAIVDYTGDGWHLGGKVVEGMGKMLRKSDSLSIDSVFDGTVNTVTDSAHDSETQKANRNVLFLHGGSDGFDVGVKGWKIDSSANTTEDGVTTVVFNPITGLADVVVPRIVTGETNTAEEGLIVSASAEVAKGVKVGLEAGNQKVKYDAAASLNGAQVLSDEGVLRMPILGANMTLDSGNWSAGLATRKYLGDAPHGESADATGYAAVQHDNLQLVVNGEWVNGAAGGGVAVGLNSDPKELAKVRSYQDLNNDYSERMERFRITDALIDSVIPRGTKAATNFALTAGFDAREVNADGAKKVEVYAAARIPVVLDNGLILYFDWVNQTGGANSSSHELDAGLQAIINEHFGLGFGARVLNDGVTERKDEVMPFVGARLIW